MATKKIDEKFCEECGAIINKKAEICPKCGCRVMEQPTNSNSEDKPKGSTGWLIFWIICFWPVAIIYYFTRKWK